MTEKTWKPWKLCDCPDCLSSVEVLSAADAPTGWVCEGDSLRCSDPTCPRHTEDLGHVVVCAEDDVRDDFDPWPIGDDDRPFRPEGVTP